MMIETRRWWDGDDDGNDDDGTNDDNCDGIGDTALLERIAI